MGKFKWATKLFIIMAAFCFYGSSFAAKFTISGYVYDQKTGEKLVGANVYDAISFAGVSTNRYGFYSITINEGDVELTSSFVGYQVFVKKLNLSSDITVNIALESDILLEEVVAVGQRVESKVESTQMGVAEIPIKTIHSMPVFMGETDVLKTIQLLPGVQSGSEGTSGLYVRGGGPDQNLILLDGVPVYNVSHLFGFFSVFNGDAIQSVKLIKGGFPARYGGRLSSVVDVQMKEGNNKKLSGKLQTGLIATKITLEGPIVNENTSFIISGRRTYIDLLAQPLIVYASKQEDMDYFRAGYYFYDLNGKINHKFSDKSRLYFSFYNGLDKAYTKLKDKGDYEDLKTDFKLRWGNITSALRWNYLFSNKLFANTTLTYSRYKFLTAVEAETKDKEIDSTDEYEVEYFSGIDDWAIKTDFDYYPNPNHVVRFGCGLTYHTFRPGVDSYRYKNDGNEFNNTVGNANIHANEYYFYAEDDIIINDYLKTNVGLHFSGFTVDGKSYGSIQPRLAARLKLSEKLSVKAAYTHMDQYIHLLSNTSIGLPTDLWLPVTDSIKPQKSVQYALGAVYAINDIIDVSVEGYYKTMDNLIEYKDGATFFAFQGDWEKKIEMGKGKSYGIELLLQKNFGKTTGWIGYTWSKTFREFENINNGKEFPYRYDRRHDISLVVHHKFSEKIDVGLTWVYGTGNAVTLATEQYMTHLNNYNYIEHFDSRNDYRAPAYHRLDIGANFHKPKHNGKRTWSIGVYNAYSRKNPFYLRLEKDKLEVFSLFPIIPYFSYKYEF